MIEMPSLFSEEHLPDDVVESASAIRALKRLPGVQLEEGVIDVTNKKWRCAFTYNNRPFLMRRSNNGKTRDRVVITTLLKGVRKQEVLCSWKIDESFDVCTTALVEYDTFKTRQLQLMDDVYFHPTMSHVSSECGAGRRLALYGGYKALYVYFNKDSILVARPYGGKKYQVSFTYEQKAELLMHIAKRLESTT